MFNFFFRPYVPGFRVRLQDDVPGFNIDGNGLPRPETTWPDEMRPGPATPQYPDAVQTLTPHTIRFPTPGPEVLVQSAPPIGLAGFGVRPQDDVPGFNVRPQDDVPGFNLDENGVQRQERTGFDGMRPGSATPQYSDTAQTLAPPPSVEDPVRPAPPQPPEWLYKLLTIPLPPLPNALDPVSGRRIVPYEPLINPVRSFPTTDQNVRVMGDARADVPETTPPPALGTVEGRGTEGWPSFDVPNPLADINAHPDAATARNVNYQPVGQEAMGEPWPESREDSQQSGQTAVAGPQDLPGAGIPFVLAKADGDDAQEAQQQTPRPQKQQTQQMRPPAPSATGQGRTPPAPRMPGKPGMETTELERRREQEFADLNRSWWRLKEADRRQPIWNQVIRELPPKITPGSKLQDLLPDNWEEFLDTIDPRYLAWTRAAAERHQIPPELLARLLFKESNYNKDEVSPTGALGIAQLTPIAVKALGLDPREFAYRDPKASIDAGAAYLAQQYRQFKNWPKAVAAYNAGPTFVYKWLEGLGPDWSAMPEDDKKAAKWKEMKTRLRYIFRGQPGYFDLN